jgi:uncharacterized membrane protein YdjX (TVP38/TMEM64 family)
MTEHTGEVTAESGGRAGSWKPIVFGVVVVALIVATKVLPVAEYLQAALEWVQSIGVWGPVVIVGIYILACVLFVPGVILTLAAGFLFKLVLGTVAVSIGSTLGACAAFLVGRFLARDWIAQKVGNNEKFDAIDKAVGQEGFKIVLLTRLSPIFPFNLLNYAFGLTKVRFTHYALASWIGMLPGTIMYVYFGSAARSLADVASGGAEFGAAKMALLVIGLVLTVFLALFVARIAKRAIADAVPDDDEGQEEST